MLKVIKNLANQLPSTGLTTRTNEKER